MRRWSSSGRSACLRRVWGCIILCKVCSAGPSSLTNTAPPYVLLSSLCLPFCRRLIVHFRGASAVGALPRPAQHICRRVSPYRCLVGARLRPHGVRSGTRSLRDHHRRRRRASRGDPTATGAYRLDIHCKRLYAAKRGAWMSGHETVEFSDPWIEARRNNS